MKTYELMGNQYQLMYADKDCFVYEKIKEKVTDYFLPFDYIFGDYACDKLRLKGFYEKENPAVQSYNNIENIETYKNAYCAYGAKTFLLKKVK